MNLASLARPELIFPSLPGTDRPTVLRSLAGLLAGVGAVPNAEQLYERLWEREQLDSTGIGYGVAIPHCKLPGLDKALLAIAVTCRDVDFAAIDGAPVRVLFLVVSPSDNPAEHLTVLAAITRWLKENPVQQLLDVCDDADALFARLKGSEV